MNEKKLPTPPYVAYKTLTGFLDRFKQGVPGRIDRGLMGSMSGASQSQVTVALKYLRFITDQNLPTDLMRNYVASSEAQRAVLLEEILRQTYPFLFGTQFDLESATASQLREAFEANTTATGETVTRCIAFFKDAAEDTSLAVSPYITQKKARVNGPRKRAAPRKPDTPPPAPPSAGYANGDVNPLLPRIPAEKSLLLWGLFKRLPEPGTSWPKFERDQWTQTLNNVLLLEYREE